MTKADVVRDLIKLRESMKEHLEKLDSLIETLEIMSDEEFTKSIEKGLKDIGEGNVVDFEELIKEIKD